MGTSALIFVGSLLGRSYARKNNLPSIFFSISACMIPACYMIALNYKHRNFSLSHYRKRPTFHEILDQYPVTRRAWKRAIIIREQEMSEIRSKVKEL